MTQVCKCPKTGLIYDFVCKKGKHNMSGKCTFCYELFVDYKTSPISMIIGGLQNFEDERKPYYSVVT